MANGTKTTRHTCGGPVFGKKTPGCPRCDELLAGAAPVRWAGMEIRRRWATVSASFPQHSCAAAGCGPVCTFGDW